VFKSSQWLEKYCHFENEAGSQKDLSSVVRSIAGYLTIFIGLDATLLFLNAVRLTNLSGETLFESK
jgi:hypothetical protein